jgi:hypothetical protein
LGQQSRSSTRAPRGAARRRPPTEGKAKRCWEVPAPQGEKEGHHSSGRQRWPKRRRTGLPNRRPGGTRTISSKESPRFSGRSAASPPRNTPAGTSRQAAARGAPRADFPIRRWGLSRRWRRRRPQRAPQTQSASGRRPLVQAPAPPAAGRHPHNQPGEPQARTHQGRPHPHNHRATLGQRACS